MKDDQYQTAMETWADAELESAPDLRPTPEMHRLVRANQKRRRPLALSSPWALAGAAAALVLVVALLALLLRSPLLPGSPAGEVTLIAQREGREASTPVIKGGEKGTPEVSPGDKGRGPAAFSQLAFEYYEQDVGAMNAIDLLDPPPQSPALTPDHNYRLRLEPARDLHLYLYQLTSSGSLVQLFPNETYSPARNPVEPGQALTLPSEPNWLYRDGPPGEERLIIIVSPEPLAELEDSYARYTQDPDQTSRRETLASLLEMLDTVVDAQPGGTAAWDFVFQRK